jgi:hypothetical protein
MIASKSMRKARWPIAGILLAGLSLASTAQPRTPTEAPQKLPPKPEISEEVLASRPSAPPRDRPPEKAPDTTQLFAQLELLYEFLSLPPEQIIRIQNTLTMIENLSTEERARMRQRLERMQVDIGQTEQTMTLFTSFLNESEQLEFRRFWLSLKTLQRESLREQFTQTGEDQKSAWIQQQLDAYRKQQREVHQRLHSTVSRSPQPGTP